MNDERRGRDILAGCFVMVLSALAVLFAFAWVLATIQGWWQA